MTTCSIIILAIYVVFNKTSCFIICVNSYLFCCFFIAILGCSFYSGGIKSPVLPWFALVPITSVWLLELGLNSVIWTLLSCSAPLFFGVAAMAGFQFPILYSTQFTVVFGTLCIAGLTMILSAVAFIFGHNRNQAMAAMMDSQHALAEAQQIGQLGSWELNLMKNQLTWSAEMYKITGQPISEAPLPPDALIQITHPEDRLWVTDAYTSSLRPGGRYDIECRIIRQSDQQCRWVRACCEHVFDSQGRVVRSIGSIQDITRSKTLEAELRATALAAEDANKAKSAFLAMMSHEIRTPLSGVVGTSELLSDTPLGPGQIDYVQTIHSSAQALLEVVDDILDLSKLDAGKIELEPLPFSPRKVLTDIIRIMRAHALQQGIELILSVEDTVPDGVLGDPTRLRQVLLNLVRNAVKFTEIGQVTLGCAEAGQDTLRFSVSDTGIGIGDEAREKLFQVFSQADVSIARRFGGTGLGLAICRHLVELMGGKIGVDSQVGQGSNFYFVLPLPPIALPKSSELPALLPLDLLLAEDNPVNAKVLQALLARAGHSVTLVEHGQGAIEAAMVHQFDAILMDVRMPIVDGLTATRTIRALAGERGRVPIIGVTANAFAEDRQECLAAGMNGYVSKPVSMAGLSAAIAAAIRPQSEKNEIC